MKKNHNITFKPCLLQIKSHKSKFLTTRHPWIFSGAIKSIPKALSTGDIVQIDDPNTGIQATGYYTPRSIAIRVLDWQLSVIDAAFWKNRLASCIQKRQAAIPELFKQTNAFRLINGEGDLIPGLIIDVYSDNIHLEYHNEGVYASHNLIENAIKSITQFENHVLTITKKWTEEQAEDHIIIAKENDHVFECNLTNGQKTGFFLDQRDNRKLLQSQAENKSILNLFCYTGGFSIYALSGKAASVTSVDISKPALETLEKNIHLNDLSTEAHETIAADITTWIKDHEKTYDIVIVDPPAFAKSRAKKHNAVQAYKRLNIKALQLVKPGGLLYTFSCSQVVTKELFEHTIRSAAIESKKQISILHYLSQGADHPINIFHQEGHYLKGLVLHVA